MVQTTLLLLYAVIIISFRSLKDIVFRVGKFKYEKYLETSVLCLFVNYLIEVEIIHQCT
jgi:hypothetical protein